MNGGAAGDRTPGLDSAIVALSQLSYCPMNSTNRPAYPEEYWMEFETQEDPLIAVVSVLLGVANIAVRRLNMRWSQQAG